MHFDPEWHSGFPAHQFVSKTLTRAVPGEAAIGRLTSGAAYSAPSATCVALISRTRFTLVCWVWYYPLQVRMPMQPV